MPRKFVTLDVEEISNVTHPANKRKYLVIKAARGEKNERLPRWEHITKQAEFEALSDSEKLSLFYELGDVGMLPF